MSARPLSFLLEARDPDTRGRAGTVTTPHGTIRTPVFMPVGTQGAVRNLSPDQVRATGAQIILANTYHLHIRPGSDLVKKLGGLHRMMGYDIPILTDSGGFQVFSLPRKEINEDGVAFQYEVNGDKVLLTPELSMKIQQELGADIAMSFDECTPYPCSHSYALEALERTTRWERRSRQAHTRPDQALFGIVQGSVFEDLRRRSAREIIDIGFDGYAVGGLSVGEGLEIMSRVLEFTVPELPEDRPRYLMGVGLPEDLVAGVELGIDMFDCVIPTRHARGGILYTFQGRIRIQHSRYRRDAYPIDTRCTCYTCRNFSRAYLRHLFSIREVLANTLASIHNIHFYQELMARMRQAILEGRFASFKRTFLEQYKPDKARVHVVERDEAEDDGLREEEPFDLPDGAPGWTRPDKPARDHVRTLDRPEEPVPAGGRGSTPGPSPARRHSDAGKRDSRDSREKGRGHETRSAGERDSREKARGHEARSSAGEQDSREKVRDHETRSAGERDNREKARGHKARSSAGERDNRGYSRGDDRGPRARGGAARPGGPRRKR